MGSRAPVKEHPRRIASRFLLSGLAVCGKCGKALIGQDAKSGIFSYYICGSLTKRGAGSCSTKYLNSAKFEHLVTSKIKEHILTTENLTKLVELDKEEMDLASNDLPPIYRPQSLLEAGLSSFLIHIDPKHVFIHSWYGSCWNCGERRRVAIVCDNGGESMQWSQSFPPEILFALRKYTELGCRRTNVVRQEYIANICPYYRSVQGDFHLHEELIGLLADGQGNEIETMFVALR